MSAHNLNASQLDLWLVRTERLHDPGLLARYADLLSPAEHERLGTLRGEHAKRQYLIARALIRTTLSRYAPIAPGCWQLTVNAHGRPEVVPGQSRLDLRFNASHTTDLVCCAVTLGRSVGVDAELHELHSPVLALADRFLAPREANDVAARPPEQRLERFFRYWTLRESYVKALGVGLADAPTGVSFTLGEGDAVAIDGTSSQHWRCWQWRPTAMHTVSASAAFAPNEDVHVRVHDVIPLG
ncbi:MAG TPA: 4'-phosphopantetheinyl transferase superfamily protein [Nannocystaceae bacterium]|nr:4'-phosphopantetheinyl transferase superfamily protein [Nannocystaceae bacterium]